MYTMLLLKIIEHRANGKKIIAILFFLLLALDGISQTREFLEMQ